MQEAGCAGKVGLALGGGVARGLAHIGVLKVLAEEGIRPDFVAGTSAGSLVGALFCHGLDWRQIREVALGVEWKDLVSFRPTRLGFARTGRLEAQLEKLLEGARFEDLALPLCAVAVDIANGEEVLLDRGPVARAVRASCSIPGIFEPTPWEERLLVDGGLINDVPADVAAAMGAETVIAVDLNRNRVGTRPPENLFDVILDSLNILLRNSVQKGIAAADVRVVPDLAGLGYRNLRLMDTFIQRGEAAMRAAVGQLHALSGGAMTDRRRGHPAALGARRLAREARTVGLMIGLYCRRFHRPRPGAPCPECEGLRAYALERIARCPHGERKPVCARCPVHCYRPQRREEIRRVMRFAGPRMLLVHPVLAIGHLMTLGRQAALAHLAHRFGRARG